MEEKNLFDILTDPNNKEPIDLMAEDGVRVKFEQVAVVPYNGKLYCILKPLTHIDGIGDNDAMVFYIDVTGEEPIITLEMDEDIAIKIFDKYYELLEEAKKNHNS